MWQKIYIYRFFQNRYPIMVKCLNIGKNIGKPIYRSISSLNNLSWETRSYELCPEHVSGVERKRSRERSLRSYFLQSGERLSEDSAPLAQYALHRSLNPRCPLVICWFKNLCNRLSQWFSILFLGTRPVAMVDISTTKFYLIVNCFNRVRVRVHT